MLIAVKLNYADGESTTTYDDDDEDNYNDSKDDDDDDDVDGDDDDHDHDDLGYLKLVCISVLKSRQKVNGEVQGGGGGGGGNLRNLSPICKVNTSDLVLFSRT